MQTEVIFELLLNRKFKWLGKTAKWLVFFESATTVNAVGPSHELSLSRGLCNPEPACNATEPNC